MRTHSLKHRIEAKLFNGYVLEPIPCVILACFVGLVFLVIALWATYDSFLSVEVNNIYTEECVITDYYKDGTSCVLISNKGNLLEMPVDSIAEYSLLDNLIATKEAVLISTEDLVEVNDKIYSIVSISNKNGNTIVAETDISRANEVSQIKALAILWGACLGYWGFIILAYRILCQAPRFPKVAALLIRAPYRNF